MTQVSARNDYFRMFRSYPDVVHVDELREMLGGIGRTTDFMEKKIRKRVVKVIRPW